MPAPVVLRDTIAAISTGVTNFTSSGFGTPAGAIIVVCNANSTNNPQVNQFLSIGFWDGTNVRCCSMHSKDGSSSSEASRILSTTHAVVQTRVDTFLVSSDWTISNITDGVRITMDTDGTGVERHAAVLLLPSSMNCKVGTFTPNTTQNGTATSESLGFDPKALLFGCVGTTNTSGSAHAILSYGACVDDGSLTQRQIMMFDRDGLSTTVTGMRVETDSCLGQFYNDSVTWTGEVTAMGSDDFTVTTRDGGSGSDIAAYMAIGNCEASLKTLTTPTSAVSDPVTGTGFQPEALISSLIGRSTTDVNQQDLAVCVGMSDATQDSAHSAESEDAQGTSDASSYSDAKIINLRDENGAEDVTATVSSFDSDGFTRNYSAVNASARKGWDLALAEVSAGSAAILPRHPLRPFRPNIRR